MRETFRRGAAVLLALLFAAPLRAEWREGPERVVVDLQGSYAEVRRNLETAIVNQGLVVSSVSHVGDMLARTGRDLGIERRVYGDAEVVEFCSARLTRDMLVADPHAIVNCPYRIAVYTLAGEPGTVYLAYSKPAGDGDPAAYAAIGALLRTLVENAQW